jgi:3-hydroxyisobutyrate dehydrogenase-like beta-hydroxyacid dehydrogenase
MTSNSPAAARPVRERAMKQGVEVLEAPAGGGIAAAREGTLQLFVGGEPSVVERHRAVLEVLGDPGRIVHVGGHGTGYTVKLLVNLLWFGQAVATAEDRSTNPAPCRGAPPPLDEAGHQQARRLAAALGPQMPRGVVASPLL